VAREQGFPSWQALGTHVTTRPRGAHAIADRPVHVLSVDDDGTTHDVDTTRDWDVALELLRDGELRGLHTHGQATDAMLARVAELQRLTVLRLGGSKAVTDEGIRRLATLTDLCELDLSGCAIGDAALEVVRHLPNLRRINLSGTHVSDAGIAQLAACRALGYVDLAWTATGDGAIAALVDMPSLSHLRSGHRVTDAGLAALHDYPVFKRWHGGDVQMTLMSFEASPNSLMLRGAITDRGLARLRGLDGLVGLNVDDAALGLTGAALVPLIDLPHLGFLAFDAKDDAMPHIARMSALRMLMAQDTTAGDDGYIALGASRSLEYFWGRRSHGLQRRGFQALAKIPTLRGLSASCMNVDAEGLAALPSFPALRELMPMDVRDDDYRFIAQCTQLEALTLMYCRETGDVATSHLATLPNVRRYFASYTYATDRTPALLAAMPALEAATLHGIPGITNAGIEALGRSASLRSLSLAGMQHVTTEVAHLLPARVRLDYTS
jgi:hypothetical protein